MQLEDTSFDADNFDIYDSLGRFKKKESRKIVLLELMALIYANDEMHEEERKVLEVILREFDFNNALFVICQEWAKTMISQFKQGNALIEL